MANASQGWRATFRDWERGDWTDWVVPAVVAALWGVAGSLQAGASVEQQRTLVALAGPVLALSGLHARTGSYLHSDARMRALPLPIDPREHFAAALARHRFGLARTVVLGSAVVLLSTMGSLNLLFDWLMFALALMLVEPAIAALGSYGGRRFPADSIAHQLQTSFGGGWTLPEAVVHLYGPALGLGVVMALALPGQLAIDAAFDGSLDPSLVGLAGGGLLLAALLRASAPWLYAQGMFEAVPYLAEATKTLAGPPVPESPPKLVDWVSDPMLRLSVLQFYRLTPVPTLRLVLLGAASLWASQLPSVAVLGVVLASGLLWVVPATVVAEARATRARLAASLPLPRRDGTHPLAWVLLLGPPIVALTIPSLTWLLT